MTTAAILLAAGQSRRMGRCKQLLPLGDTTVIGICLATLGAAGLGDIVVVVSPDGGAVAAEAERAPGVRISVNREPEGDMASSIRAGRDALAPEVDSVVVALCDYPLVRPDTVRRLRETGESCGAIVIPCHEGRRGHPLFIPRRLLDGLYPGMTLRDLLKRPADHVAHLDVDDSGILRDMDLPEDYRSICAAWEQARRH